MWGGQQCKHVQAGRTGSRAFQPVVILDIYGCNTAAYSSIHPQLSLPHLLKPVGGEVGPLAPCWPPGSSILAPCCRRCAHCQSQTHLEQGGGPAWGDGDTIARVVVVPCTMGRGGDSSRAISRQRAQAQRTPHQHPARSAVQAQAAPLSSSSHSCSTPQNYPFSHTKHSKPADLLEFSRPA